MLSAVLSGCTAKHYRKSADKEVYRIIQNVERDVFGQTNSFEIDTAYSQRPPAEIHPGELIDDRLQTNSQRLTLEDALNLSVTNSRRFQTEKERLYLSALTLTGARYQFSPQFFGTIGSSIDRDKDGQWSSSSGAQIRLSQLLKSGGRLSVTLANDFFRYYTGNARRSIVSSLSVTLAQPLLRGFGRNNPDVEALTQAERNMVYAVRNFGFFQDEFSLEIVSDYFGLLAQKDVIRNRYTNYLNRVDSTKRLEERSRDRERRSDVDLSRQAELAAKNTYVNAVAAYWNVLDQFKIKLGLPLPYQLALDDSALDKVGETGLVPVPLDPTAAYHYAVQRQLPLLNAIDRFEDSKRKITLAASQLRPGLDLFASASLDSERPTDYTSFDPDDVRTSLGVELDLPLDRLRERNNYRATLVTFESELRNLTLALDNLKENIENGLRTVEQRRQNYLIQKNALALADRRVASAPLLLQAGRTEVRDMIEAQDAQVEAQNAVTSALVAYQEARLQLMLDIGALQADRAEFWLQDHLRELPLAPTAHATEDPGEKPVLPPDQIFNTAL